MIGQSPLRNYLELMQQQGGEQELAPPKNYKPSTPQQRAAWNKFLMYVMDKGYRGNVELDKKDQSLGLKLIQEYNKENPDNAVSPEFIPIAQYENAIIRKQKRFPDLDDKQSEAISRWLPKSYEQQEVSAIDGWLGSKTSKLQYPEFRRMGNEGKQINYGADYKTYLSGDNPFATKVLGIMKK